MGTMWLELNGLSSLNNKTAIGGTRPGLLGSVILVKKFDLSAQGPASSSSLPLTSNFSSVVRDHSMDGTNGGSGVPTGLFEVLTMVFHPQPPKASVVFGIAACRKQ